MHESDRYAGLCFQQQGEETLFFHLPGGGLGKGRTIDLKKDVFIVGLPQQAAQDVFPFQAERRQLLYDGSGNRGGLSRQPFQFRFHAEVRVRPFRQGIAVFHVMQQVFRTGGYGRCASAAGRCPPCRNASEQGILQPDGELPVKILFGDAAQVKVKASDFMQGLSFVVWGQAFVQHLFDAVTAKAVPPRIQAVCEVFVRRDELQ